MNTDVSKLKLIVNKAKFDAEKAKSDAEAAKSNAEKAKSDAEKAKSDAEKAKSDAETARVNIIERLRILSARLKGQGHSTATVDQSIRYLEAKGKTFSTQKVDFEVVEFQ